jgi:hypothetical protein
MSDKADTTFSTRSNAKRAAEKAINAGTGPSIDYGIRTHASGRFEIIWKDRAAEARERLGMAPVTEAAADIATAAEEAETPAHIIATGDETLGEVKPLPTEERAPNANAEPSEEFSDNDPDPWPPGTRVQVALSKKPVRLGTVDYQVDSQYWRVFLDGAPNVSGLYRADQLSATDAPMPEPKPKAMRRASAQPANRKPSRSNDIDAAAARGVMPPKPIVTSKANPHYQKRFDQLEKWAMADDWNAIRGYEVKGINSYAKMVKQYRDRLLMAHEVAVGSRDDDKAA